ncbi:hypothetical protein D9Q98_004324 [Chlorella vulgaris]|uniref:Domain of unknown function at the cortex 1 domain-containing protein n=1 Tax=Chlorella vulgaris TaxID=3077 RepID=A0A9D4TPF0_CHLVU|nr:hypothetical protein D9Q98_004324 [Chlorella vulgaris]
MPSVAPASEGSSDSSLDDSEVWQDCSSCSSTLEDAEEQLEREQHTAADARSDWRPTEADIAAAASAPVLVAAHPGLPYQQILSGSPQDLPVNTGSPIEFETPLFTGRACVWVRGLPGAPPPVFEGRRRRTMVTVQGRFRRPVPLDDLVTGQEFGAVENLPPTWLVEGVLLRVARALSPSCEIGPASAPFMLMPVAAGCSEMVASLPGQEPSAAAPPSEDLRLWDPSLVLPNGAPLPAAQRKSHFSKAGNREGRCFPTDLVFTFYFYQHVVDVGGGYELDVGLHRFSLSRYLAGQPLQLMMRDRSSGQYLYCLHLWHQCLLKGAAR